MNLTDSVLAYVIGLTNLLVGISLGAELRHNVFIVQHLLDLTRRCFRQLGRKACSTSSTTLRFVSVGCLYSFQHGSWLLQREPWCGVKDLIVDWEADSYISSILTDRDDDTAFPSNHRDVIRVLNIKLREEFHGMSWELGKDSGLSW